MAASPVWRYEIAERQPSGELAIEADFPGRCPKQLEASPKGGPFLRGLKMSAAAKGCHARYRFLLKEAAAALNEPWLAGEAHGLLLSSPSLWLLHPAAPAARLRFHVVSAPGSGFTTGIFPAPGKRAGEYELSFDELDDASYGIFGPFRLHTIESGGGRVDLALAPGAFTLSEADIVEWVTQSAKAISSYYGKFPARRVLVFLWPAAGRGLESAKTFGGGGLLITAGLGAKTLKSDIMNGWVLPHEMVHTALPEIGYRNTWFHEGLATYIEPLARLRIGNLTAEKVWGDLVEGLPKGLSDKADGGLDNTQAWGRIYWGGALFFLLADIEIRKKTSGKKGLEDGLRAIVNAGGNMSVSWDIERVIAVADKAVGSPVLRELYAKMSTGPAKTDLDALWRELGVVMKDDKISFDDKAPLARIRKGITPN